MKVLVLGASLNPQRYSYLAINDLVDYDHEVFAIGTSEGELRGVNISKTVPATNGIHTVTMYLSAKNQVEYYDYLLQLKPSRVIFNPGADNNELEQQLTEIGVEVLSACTLVMLRTNQFD
ncbi:MAG: putative CoA-binding protein [Crocinitomix sp.]|jgi:predicted CoA-binding protein